MRKADAQFAGKRRAKQPRVKEQIIQEQVKAPASTSPSTNQAAGDLFGQQLPDGDFTFGALRPGRDDPPTRGSCVIFCSKNIPTRDNGLEYAAADVIATCGGKHALYNTLQAILDPGDEVVIPGPYWVSYADMTVLAEGAPKILMGSESKGFKVSAADLEAAIGPKTRMVLLNSPSNPTGATYSEAEMAEFGRVFARHPSVCCAV
ncbi:MAG: aminotransferase class I/II-fold pyridoxal phosphate-dependent enzyme, partial [Nitrospira sp.]|nr:aminotransferase class I/II-fold pyridoxal phosphate-dependent enzyme [Nitrospira sp.]